MSFVSPGPNIHRGYNIVLGDPGASGPVGLPGMVFLMHANNNLKEEIANRIILPPAAGSQFSGALAKFAQSYAWPTLRTSAADPTQYFEYAGAPVIPAPEVTGWAIEFWMIVAPGGNVGAAAGREQWLYIDADTDNINGFMCLKFNFQLISIGAAGGVQLWQPSNVTQSGTFDHVVFQHSPGTTYIDAFLNGNWYGQIPGYVPGTLNFHNIRVGDQSFSTPFFSTVGFIDELAIWNYPRYPAVPGGTYVVPTAPYPPP